MVETWTYDQASRMTQIDYDKGTTHYSTLDYAYDPAGRRTKVWAGFARVTLPAATTANATYDAANELKTWNGTNLTYDQNGNLATNGAQTYTFDERNQLTATSGGTSTFKYDGLGRRYEKTVSGTTTRNLYDGPNVVQELNGSNAVTANSITGFAPDQVFWRNSGGVNKNVLTDALGSTLATYNSNATPGLQNKFTYDPYGTPDSTAFPYLFTGTNYDSATGLQYNRARYYAPGFGRFTSEDPIGVLGGSANEYLYGANAPTVYTDPSGLILGQFGSALSGILAFLWEHRWQILTIGVATACIVVSFLACVGLVAGLTVVQTISLATDDDPSFWPNATCGVFKNIVLATGGIGAWGAAYYGGTGLEVTVPAVAGAAPTIVVATASARFAGPGCGL